MNYNDQIAQARLSMYELQPDEVWGNSIKKLRRGIWNCLGSPVAVEEGLDRESIYQTLFPKTFTSLADCYDPTSIGVAIWEVGYAEVDEHDTGSLAALGLDTWRDIKQELTSFDWRTYFLDSTCADMLQRGKLNGSLELSEILFSFPAFVVALPKSLVVSSTDKEGNFDPVIAIAVSRTFTVCFTSGNYGSLSKKGLDDLGIKKEDLRSLNKRLITEGDGSWKEIRGIWLKEFGLTDYQDQITLAPVLNIGGVTLNGNNLPIRFPLMDKSIRSSLSFLSDYAIEEFGDELGASEALELTRFTLKLLLFLSAKPEEVDDGSKEIKKIRYRRGRLMNDSKWSPCFIGRKYGTSMKKQGYGERGKIRSHWRRAHQRGYWTGKGRTKYILNWIDPCYINDPEKRADKELLINHKTKYYENCTAKNV